MHLLVRAEWPQWVRNAYPSDLTPRGLLVGVPPSAEERSPEELEELFILLPQIYNVKIARITRAAQVESWCYPGSGQAVPAFMAWDGTGDPDDRWVRSTNAVNGVIRRRHPSTGALVVD